MATVVYVPQYPKCDFADPHHPLADCPMPARYDFRTHAGPWANGCEHHWQLYRAAPALGAGYAQRYDLESER